MSVQNSKSLIQAVVNYIASHYSSLITHSTTTLS